MIAAKKIFVALLIVLLFTPVFGMEQLSSGNSDDADDETLAAMAASASYDAAAAAAAGDDFVVVNPSDLTTGTLSRPPSLVELLGALGHGLTVKFPDALRYHCGAHSAYLIAAIKDGSLARKLPKPDQRSSKAGHALEELAETLRASQSTDPFAQLKIILHHLAAEKGSVAPVHLEAIKAALKVREKQIAELQRLVEVCLGKPKDGEE